MKSFTIILTWVVFALAAPAQTATPPQPPPPPAQSAPEKAQPETKITAEQARELFASVDQILQFVSRDTGLPIKHPVKRQLADRAQVLKFVQDRMKSDEDSKRLERSAVVLKKFGLLPRAFDLRTYLLELLGEQVAGFYDARTKTVYLLDWVEPEQQKPVLAHELTHALQDQNFDLLKLQKDAKKNDPTGLEVDEHMAARQAVIEGQGMLVLMDYMLAPLGSSVAKQPDLVDAMQATMTQSGPGMAVFNRAPMFLQQVLLFPYRFGTTFERDLLVQDGQREAFAGTLRNPPQDTRQVMQPKTYLTHESVPPLKPVNFDKLTRGYKKWDLSIMGEFDVFLLMQQYATSDAADVLSRDWRGGYYWAGLGPGASKTAEEDPRTTDVAVAYVSKWSSADAAAQFAGFYAAALSKRYRSVKLLPGSADLIAPAPLEREPQKGKEPDKDQPKVTITVWPRLNGRASWETEEGQVTIEPRGDRVLATESLDPATVERLRQAVFGLNH